MLSDEELLKIFDAHYSFASGHTAVRTRKAVRAVEAAVRADQIEKDAAIAENQDPVDMALAGQHGGNDIAAAIRAQQNGDSNAE